MIGISFRSVKSIKRYILSAKKPTEECEMMTNTPPPTSTTPKTLLWWKTQSECGGGEWILPTTWAKAKFLIEIWLCLQDLDSWLTFLLHGVRQSPTCVPGFQIPHLKPDLWSSRTCPKITWSCKALLPQFWCEKLGKRES